MFADDFLSRVAFGPLRTQIPTGYDPLCIEHKDCVVGDAVYKVAELALALIQLGKNVSDLASTLLDPLFQAFTQRLKLLFSLSARAEFSLAFLV